eukprot:CAMPEP_0170553584 /NCGR_PEP_ID=MMETSP0211-20121228/11422_1 /TAXON_ID=311385 /ORGANISM="Pseudokeronopsis sp., Strain OXSARD2" /LENGTH=83 /DNA_ID=CAMNT_0010862025 /DNA_START=1604 /DNA_END=1852 /DNA_ORIENTATION=-
MIAKKVASQTSMSGFKFNKAHTYKTKEQKLKTQTLGKVKGLTKIIWSCSNLINENDKERQSLQNVEKYYTQEFKSLERKHNSV